MESLSSLGILKITTVHRLNKRGTDNSMLVHIEEDTLQSANFVYHFLCSPKARSQLSVLRCDLEREKVTDR